MKTIKKKLISMLLILSLIAGFTSGMVTPTTAGAAVTMEVPDVIRGVYQIGTAEELYWFAYEVNRGNSTANAVLTNDIVLNEGNLSEYDGTGDEADAWQQWTPIGLDFDKGYDGTFDGQNHTISGIYVNQDMDYAGLFGVSRNGEIKNVGMVNSYIRGRKCVGGICGRSMYTNITNCYNTGKVSGDLTNAIIQAGVGGVCGFLESATISDSYNTGESILLGTNWPAGGVCGYMSYGIVTNCYNTGKVTATGDGNRTGGVCGALYGNRLTNVYNTGKVSTSGANSNASGLCAYLDGATIVNAYNTGEITASGSNAIENAVYGVNKNSTVTSCYFLEGSGSGVTGATTLTEEQFAGVTVMENLNNYIESASLTATCSKWFQGEKSPSFGNIKILEKEAYLIHGENDSVDLPIFLDGIKKEDITIQWMDTKLQGVNVEIIQDGNQNYFCRVTTTTDTPFGNCSFRMLLDKEHERKASDNATLTVTNENMIPIEPDVDSDGVYQIGTAGELCWFADHATNEDVEANAVLTNDIVLNNGDLSGYDETGDTANGWQPWTPIGTQDDVYQGTFDGQNHTISGLYINNSANYAGLFACMTGNGVIQNVGIVNSFVKGRLFTGSVCGLMSGGSIINCYNTGAIVADDNNYIYRAGGICGKMNGGSITNCYNRGAIRGSGEDKFLGGVCAYMTSGSITNSYNMGEITATGLGAMAGGLCAYMTAGSITNSYNTGTISEEGNACYAGGVCAYMNGGSIANNYNTGTVTVSGSSPRVDAVCAYKGSAATITSCHYLAGTAVDSTGSTSATADEFADGTVAGRLNTYIRNNGLETNYDSWFQGANHPVFDTIVVGEQQGTLTYRTPGTATFLIQKDIADADSLDVKWISNNHTGIQTKMEPVSGGSEGAYGCQITTTNAAQAGTYEFHITYNELQSEKMTLTIGKSTPTPEDVTVTLPTDTVYNQQTKTAQITANENAVGLGAITVKYKKDNQGPLLDAPSEIGTYQVYAIIAGNDSYNDAQFDTGESFTIAYDKAPATILYNDAAKADTYLPGIVKISATDYTVSDRLDGGFAASYEITGQMDAAVFVTLYFRDSEGHISEGATVSVVFKKAQEQEPAQTQSPDPTASPTAVPGGDQQNASPSSTPTPNGSNNLSIGDVDSNQNQDAATGLPKKGTTIKSGKAYYKVTVSSATNGTVTYVKPTSKKLKAITIPATIKVQGVTFKVTAIAANACKSNKKLAKVTIGKNVTKIGKNAFKNCKKLKKVTVSVSKKKVKAYTKMLRKSGISNKCKVKNKN